jgi:5-(carboxyamino)imidazole ribonucleotide mutase
MKAVVGIIMGSASDWETMQGAAETLESLGIAHEVRVVSAHRTSVPVLGVPVQTKSLNGIDSLLSIAQMPSGVPVATFAIGAAGARNAALFAAAILANELPAVRAALDAFRAAQTAAVLNKPDPRQP